MGCVQGLLPIPRELTIRMHDDERNLTVAELISETRVNGIDAPSLKSSGRAKRVQLLLGAPIARPFRDQKILEVEGHFSQRDPWDDFPDFCS
jgi:hypothetical protein